MTCAACPRPRTVTLSTGDQCCTWCERHREECEARDILAMPTRTGRQARIAGIGVKRGAEAEKNLRGVVLKMWELQRTTDDFERNRCDVGRHWPPAVRT